MRSDYTPEQQHAYHEGWRMGRDIGAVDASAIRAMLRPDIAAAFHAGHLKGIEESPHRYKLNVEEIRYNPAPAPGAVYRMAHMESKARQLIDRTVLVAAVVAWVIGLVSFGCLLWVLWRAIGVGG